MPRCLIALGANLGDALSNLSQAAAAVARLPGVQVDQVSRLVETAPVGGPPNQPRFVNAAAAISARLPVDELMGALHEIERSFGRERRSRWDARPLDIDILLYGDRVADTLGVQTPHPRMTFRPFVMGPASEVAGDWPHPLLGRTLAELNALRSSGADAVRLTGFDGPSAETARACVEEWGIAIEDAPGGQPPRLTLCGAAPGPLEGSGPTLWLPPDAPPDLLRQEVRAALQCVWPRLG